MKDTQKMIDVIKGLRKIQKEFKRDHPEEWKKLLTEEEKESAKLWRRKNPEKVREARRRYGEKKHAEIKKKYEQESLLLTDSYIKKVLRATLHISAKQITEKMIEEKREKIAQKRKRLAEVICT